MGANKLADNTKSTINWEKKRGLDLFALVNELFKNYESQTTRSPTSTQNNTETISILVLEKKTCGNLNGTS